MFCPVVTRRPRPACSASGSSSSPTESRARPAVSSTRGWATRSSTGSPVPRWPPCPRSVHGSLPPVNAPGTPVAVTYPEPASWKVVTHATTPPGPPAAAHRCPRMACIDRREAADAGPFQPDHAPGEDPAGAAHHRAALLARDVHCRDRAGRYHGRRAGVGPRVRWTVVTSTEGAGRRVGRFSRVSHVPDLGLSSPRVRTCRGTTRTVEVDGSGSIVVRHVETW